MHNERTETKKRETRNESSHQPLMEPISDYRAVFEALADAVLILDPVTSRIRDANLKACEMYGYAIGELAGMKWAGVSGDPEQCPGDTTVHIVKAGQGAPQLFEWLAQDKPGRSFWVEVNLKGAHVGADDFVIAVVRDITERKRVERELTVTRNYLNTVFNKIHDAVFVHDLKGKIIDVNDKMLEIYRCTRENAVGLSIVPDFAAPGNAMADYQPLLWKKVQAGEDQSFEWEARRPSDGGILDVEVTLTKLPLPEGDYILASIHDITERKRFERELTATKHYLATVFNNIHDAVFVHDIDGKVIDVNDKMLDMYMFSREEAVGLYIVPDYTAPSDAVDFRASWRNVLAGEDQVVECRGRRPRDGFEFDVEVFLTRLPLPAGDYILATVRDITDRKQVERELIATKDYLRTIFDSIHDAVFVHDVHGTVIDVNHNMLEMYQCTREEAIGLSIMSDYTTAEGRPDFPSIWREVITGNDAFTECKGRRPRDGFVFDVEVFLTRLPLPTGDCVLASVRNITDRKTIEKQLIKEKETFFSVLEDNPHGIALIDHRNRYVYVNPEFTAITGYELIDIPTWWDWIERIAGEMQPLARAFDLQGWRTLRGGEDREIESMIRCRNGDYKYVEFRITNLQDRRLLVLTDVTARKSAEEDLQIAKQKFQTLSESSPLGMVVVDGNNKFTFKYMNPKFRELFCCDMRTVSSIHEWLAWVNPDPVSRRGMASKWFGILEHMDSGGNRPFIGKLSGKEGLKKHIQFTPVQLQSGEILIACWDITRNKVAEGRIRERNLVLAVLNDIMASVAGSLHLSRILQALERVFVKKLKISAGTIFFSGEVEDSINAGVCWGVPDSNNSDLKAFALKCHNEGEVVYKKDIVIVKYRPGGSEPDEMGWLDGHKWRSYLCISSLAENETRCMIFLAAGRRDAFSDDQMVFYKTLGQQIGVALQNARLFEQVEQSHAQMKALSLRLVRVQEDELRYVARELHDEIGQLLTGLGLTLEMASQTPGEETASLLEAKSLADTITGLVRELSRRLRPSMLDDLGLFPTLPWLFKRFSTHSNVQVLFEHLQVDGKRFSHEVETAVYRITQEALTNVARHANVHCATVRLWSTDRSLAVQIEDQGVGFEPNGVSREENTNGLSGIRERVMLLGGRFTLETSPGAGTRLMAEFPIDMEGKSI